MVETKKIWRIVLSDLVVHEDMKKIKKSDSAMAKRIFDAIEKKLAVDPIGYGEPLRRKLSAYHKLRVGKYRVVYEVKKKEIVVHVIKIGLRRDEQVYKELVKRLLHG